MQCFAIPFKPLGPKMTKTVSYSNTAQKQFQSPAGSSTMPVIPSNMSDINPAKRPYSPMGKRVGSATIDFTSPVQANPLTVEYFMHVVLLELTL
jgi:hypothetical protein